MHPSSFVDFDALFACVLNFATFVPYLFTPCGRWGLMYDENLVDFGTV